MILVTIVLIPLVSALILAVAGHRFQQPLNILSSLLLLGCALWLLWQVSSSEVQSLALGAWPLPYAIEFYADGLSALLIVLVALVAFAVQIFQLGWRETGAEPAYLALQQGLIASAMAVLLAADLFNLYVWFELMLMALLGLLVLPGRKCNLEAGLKYFALSMLGTLLMLAAIGLIYGATGHLNFQALAQAAEREELRQSLPLFSGLLLLALFVKIGVFPLYAWLPAAYHTLPLPLLALVGGVLTKISFYVVMRLGGQVFDLSFVQEAIGWLAVVTMLSGVLGAAFHWDLRRILAFHIISQIGYLLLGIALASPAGATATGFFLAHNMLVKANLILIAGLMWQAMGHFDLRQGGGLYPARPWLAILFLISAMSLVGVPPSSGFWGKFLLLQESFDQQRFVWGGIALATGILTLYSMVKIWLEGFWKPAPATSPAQAAAMPPAAVFAVALLTGAILIMGVAPDPLIRFLQAQSLHVWGG